VWSPLGDRIMFTRRSPAPGERTRATYDLMTIPAAGGDAVEARTGTGSAWLGVYGPWARTYAWSSDAASAGAFAPPLNVATMAADGTIRAATPATARVATGAASWSPDGSRMAYVRTQAGSGTRSIWTSGADGSGSDFVIADATQPSWQPA
jgi:hypothetical protein